MSKKLSLPNIAMQSRSGLGFFRWDHRRVLLIQVGMRCHSRSDLPRVVVEDARVEDLTRGRSINWEVRRSSETFLNYMIG